MSDTQEHAIIEVYRGLVLFHVDYRGSDFVRGWSLKGPIVGAVNRPMMISGSRVVLYDATEKDFDALVEAKTEQAHRTGVHDMTPPKTMTDQKPDTEDRIYPCREPDCDVMRTKAEGGTVFSYCEKHMPPLEPDTPAEELAGRLEKDAIIDENTADSLDARPNRDGVVFRRMAADKREAARRLRTVEALLYDAFEAGWFDNHGSIADAWAERVPEIRARLATTEEDK